MSLGMPSELADYQRQFVETRQRATALTAPLTSAQFNWRPGAERWSIGECFEHLNVAARRYQENMTQAIAKGRARGLLGTGAPAKYGWFSRWFESQMEPPPKRRMKAPPAFQIVRSASLEKATIMDEFTARGKSWLELLEACDGLDLVRVKVVSPAMGIMRFPIGAAFRHQLAHERRHVWQADQVSRAPGFPS
ncbi:MAG: DinB family protein [Gemmatimonadaceae bacterium]